MFNIIENLRVSHANSYTTISAVMWHFPLQCKLVVAIFGGKLFGGSVLPASAAPVGYIATSQKSKIGEDDWRR